MTDFKSIDPVLAAECFEYDALTGDLRWKARVGDRYKARNTRLTGKIAGHKHTCTAGKTYFQVRVDGVLHYAHRIIWVMIHGPIGPMEEIDHEDGDGTNNRLSNLRLATKVQNKRNMRRLSTNTSGHTGVYADKTPGKFNARVTESGVFKTLARGVSFEEAVRIRQAYNAENGFHVNHGQDRPL